MRKKIINILLIILLFFIYFLLCANSYATNISSDISSSIFRLHVIANSDSEEDQKLKYQVRDNILNYINNLIDTSYSRTDVINILEDNLDNFKQIAKQTIDDNGFDYNVDLEIGNFYFPTKNYGNISFPAGSYDGLRIKIGEAKGQNWWCVLFPPLCFIDVTSGVVPEESKNNLEENLSEEEFLLITNNSESIKFKFKIVEIFDNFKHSIAQK